MNTTRNRPFSLARHSFGVVILALAAAAQSEPRTIQLVMVEEHVDDTRHYYVNVLAEAFARMDDEYHLDILGDVPQVRAVRMLADGQIDVFWMVQSSERDERFLSTDVGISNGFIGKRVLMIRPEDQPMFDHVQSLEDFQDLNLTVGFGQNWVDSHVWAANDLNFFEETGAWAVMFDKLSRGRGDFDYLSRSVKEIRTELASHPALVAEENLLLVYERDEAFYLPRGHQPLRDQLRDELLAMQQDGTLNQFMQQYWGEDIDALNLDNRTRINLVSPE